jgi:DnaJ-class molecular chaperone
MNPEEFYTNLGVSPGATPEELKAAYRKQAFENHPDRGGDAEKFKKVCHAYKMLTDPSYRYKDEQQNKPIQLQVMISLEQAIFGCTITNIVRKQSVKATEEGKTELKGKTDYIVVEIIDRLPSKLMRTPFVVRHPQLDFGGTKHDVEIYYSIAEHPYYRIDPGTGMLMVNIKVDLFTALKGGKVEVETLFGLRTLRIPAGLEPGEILVIKNHGDLGNLLVKTEIKYPKKQERKSDNKWKDVADVDWEREQQLDLEQDQQIQQVFIRLGGF